MQPPEKRCVDTVGKSPRPGWVHWHSIRMAWRWIRFQPGSKLAQWFMERTRDGHGRKRMIVALARKPSSSEP
ncbi:MAG: hypothetical protein OXC57_14600 [Rhodobacteraceae bacterium]|nr:hypothetical protein [Paracoccaceae bacterium]